jgi:hypothetical protein
MFCPECKAEYRPGFTRCSDCDTNLVEQLPESVRGPDDKVSHREPLRTVCTTDWQEVCVSICEQLRTVGIPFRVQQQSRQFLRDVERRFTIAVSPDHYDHAKRVIGMGRMDFTDEPEQLNGHGITNNCSRQRIQVCGIVYECKKWSEA